MGDETVYLDSLDGFAFEQVCERIFSMAGWGDVERIGGVADRGRDLIIRTPDDKQIVVECKFYSDATTVGRPIIQKLHSAVIDSHADSGIIVTTGKFSKAAIEYADDIGKRGHPIELFDLHKLMEIAHGAGIELETGKMQKIHTYPVMDSKTAAAESVRLADDMESHPTPVSDLVRVSDIGIDMTAVYFATISIRQTFSTSVGIIHDMDIRDKDYMFDGSAGTRDETGLVDFFGPPRLGMDNTPDTVRSKTWFGFEESTLRDTIIQDMVSKHTTRVSYRGRNNTTYHKTCAPTARNIHINNLRQAYVPRHTITLDVLDTKHECVLEYNGTEARESKTRWARCHDCGKTGNTLLCNECGRIAHTSWIRSHGSHCRKCGKTLCGICVWKVRHLLVFSRKFCSDCRPDNAKRSS